MDQTTYFYARMGFALCAVSVILGAFASHFLKLFIGLQEMATFETGIRYMFLHALAIVGLSLNTRRLNIPVFEWALMLFLIGITIFSGSLFGLATVNLWGSPEYTWIGALTPLGGACFILGWGLLFFKGIRIDEETLKVMKRMGNRKSKKHHHRKHHHQTEPVETPIPASTNS
jgi:uncharacterized membrane protein YgdD (TMEM256/DUF423 family)